jgi:murein DD-endopeptidase MepM/ murein hydrolase activator NlpD
MQRIPMVGVLVAAVALAACGSSEGALENPTTPVVVASPQPGGEGEADAPSAPAGEPGATSDAVPSVEPEAAEPASPLSGSVQPGESLSTILNRAGVGTAEIGTIVAALDGTLDPTTIRVGQRYEIELTEAGTLKSFRFRRSVTDSVLVVPEGEGFVARAEQVATTVREEFISATVETSLWVALTERDHDPALVDVVTDVFAYDIDFFTETRKGDQVRLLVERHEVGGEFVRYGRVLAAQYEGEAANATVLWWVENRQFVDPKGRGIERTLLKTPLKYSRITSGFNPARMHPVLHRVKSHRGVDYAAPEGTPVWAAAGGTIVFRGKKGGAGNLVVIKHAGGLKTQYMHLSRFRDGQSVGDEVDAKTVIGYVGATGLATGAHLHFGVLRNGKYVDPQSIEAARVPGVTKNRARFEKYREKVLARLASESESASG